MALTILTACNHTVHHASPMNTSINQRLRSFQMNDTISVNYEVYGEGEPSVTFIHGFGASRESWFDTLLSISGIGTLYLIDLKGHGLSSKSRDEHYSLDDQAAIVAEFTRR